MAQTPPEQFFAVHENDLVARVGDCESDSPKMETVYQGFKERMSSELADVDDPADPAADAVFTAFKARLVAELEAEGRLVPLPLE